MKIRTAEKSHKASSHVGKFKKAKPVWLSSGIAQILVLVNGIILTLTAFLIFNYYATKMTVDEYKVTSDNAGRALVESITSLENVIRLVSTVILVADNREYDGLTENIRRNIPNLSSFDQLIWLFEQSPGNWQYRTISDTTARAEGQEASYRLVPDKEFIKRLIDDEVFATKTLRIMSDLKGMDYVKESTDPHTTGRSFAFVKAVQSDDSSLGVIIGVSRAALLFDQKLANKTEIVSRFTVKDKEQDQRIFHMDKNYGVDRLQKETVEHYGFFIGDSEWEITLEFDKKDGLLLLRRVPYIILFFGFLLTAIGTLFIRNNHSQSRKLSDINNILEYKNNELELEIAERERLNVVLAIAEKDNRAIIDAVSDIIFEVDVDGNVLFLSASWVTVTGFNIERSKGNNLFSMLYPDDQEKQREDFSLLLKGHRPEYRSFTRLRISDGTFRAVELAVSMIRQDENNDLRIVGTITDVEERRRAERALAEAEKKYRAIVENAAGGLYQLTPEGLYLSANPAMARILGYKTPEEMLRMIKNANGSVYSNQAERERFMDTIIKQEHITGHETKVLTKDGTEIWVRENVRAVKDDQNNILYFEGSMENITKRKEADIALIDAKMESDMANRTKTEFIANMSHELRTPLNAIIGFSDIIKQETLGPLGQEMYKEYATDIHKSGQKLLQIINEILDISKIESGNKELNESEFQADDILFACLEMHNSRVKEKAIVVINEAKNMPKIHGEELSIKQAISNIYSNAVKFTPTGGRITLFTNTDSNGTFRLSITDTGVGMSSDDIQKALSPFGQLDNALDRSGSGTGLGLPLAQAIMKIHDGRLEILSERSIGTTVTMIFPASRILSSQTQEDHSGFLS